MASRKARAKRITKRKSATMTARRQAIARENRFGPLVRIMRSDWNGK